MNNRLLKKTAIVNAILIACVGAFHTAAVAAMIYQSPAKKSEPIANAMSFDVMEMEFFGASSESVEEARVEEVEPEVFDHPAVEELIEKEIVAVKSVDQADIVIPEKKEEVKEIKKVEKVEPIKQKVVQKPVVKPQPKVQTQNIAKNSAKQQMKGGKPLVSSSSIKFIKNPAPKRPRIAHRNKWTGNSVVMVEIDQRGIPVKVVLERSSGHDVLDKAALEAARGVKIHPYIENGQSIAIRHRMDYAF
ncbi:energy transducer TonB [Wohlfahrtiimonas larvae]|uniref:TonB C-terminal domain-containing protein n=1 Tax=Wohlfahrtiimonas larvae TaxID=1157986 RepID=A0ABP9MGE0_9GAMM|nr:energy transducer TonB [Wohlfahrtiimonas larvae]